MSAQEDLATEIEQESEQDLTSQLVGAQIASNLIRKEFQLLSELEKIDLGVEMNEKAQDILEQIRLLGQGIEARISFLEKLQEPKFYSAKDSYQFLTDIDLNGVTVVIAEFGEKTDLMSNVIDTAHSKTTYKAGMFSLLDDAYMGRKKPFIARSDGRQVKSFHISMRGLSYQHPETEGNGKLIRRIEKDRQHVGQIQSILSSIGGHAIDVVSEKKESGLFDPTFEGGVTKVALVYVMGPDNDNNRSIIDAVRDSLARGNYNVESENILLEDDLKSKFKNLKLEEKSPGLQLHRIQATATAPDL